MSFSLAVPAYVTGEAALSFLGIGMLEPTPDFGRMIFRSLAYLQTDPAYVFFPGITIFVLVLAFNLFGDALRDALDPEVVTVGAAMLRFLLKRLLLAILDAVRGERGDAS